jgi:diguanylate cyclase (GGDEF)-like protein
LRRTGLGLALGGEEFALIDPAGDLEAAKAMAEQTREAVAQKVVHHAGRGLKVKASIGIATTYLPPATEGHELISRADRRLYRAKETGRNRLVTHG